MTTATLAPWLRPASLPGDRLPLIVLGTYAATSAAARHAHAHMALPLLVPLLLLIWQRFLPRGVLDIWAIAPACSFSERCRSPRRWPPTWPAWACFR